MTTPAPLIRFPLQVTAREIGRPIPATLRFPADIRLLELLAAIRAALGADAADADVFDHTVVLIETAGRADKCLYGWDLAGAQSEVNLQKRVVALEIDPLQLIAPDTTLEEILRLFTDLGDQQSVAFKNQERRFYFVLTGPHITHVITLREIVSSPARMAFFAKILELEESIHAFLSRDAARHVSALCTRDKKAYDWLSGRARRRLGRAPTPLDLIRVATFSEKRRMLAADDGLHLVVPEMPPAKAGAFFEPFERLRDQIAHGEYIEVINPGWSSEPANEGAYGCNELYGMFALATQLTASLRAAAATH